MERSKDINKGKKSNQIVRVFDSNVFFTKVFYIAMWEVKVWLLYDLSTIPFNV